MPGAIVEQARAKINLALHVLGRRADGYHELDSAVAFADVGDVLHLEPAQATSLTIHGPFAAGLSADAGNLVLKAAAALVQCAPVGPVRIVLEKNLPVASGIGGGSADAAAALRGLMRLNDIRLAPDQLVKLALSLGADVPVCLQQGFCRMTGIGETITPMDGLPARFIVLANPLAACSTQAVFAALGLRAGERFAEPLDPQQPASWRNDLQEPAVRALPVIADVLAALTQERGLSDIRMSGSGATCFGLAASRPVADAAAARLSAQNPQWWVRAASLS
ncbi:MAG: 4-(cytidine 5'-diphospho)-2-C-methyl-D-erythritol kinase [Proteobacteria bacterium]|nr:4-(cytidine 5'-diphospho)-2-C-methyl-D-erythritol kinase [Pseudomonadota bacterium]